MKLSKLIEKLEKVQELIGQNDPEVTAGEDYQNAGDIGLISVVFPGDEEQPAILLSTETL